MTRRQDDITHIRRIIPAALPPADLPAQATDAPGGDDVAGGVLFDFPPTPAELTIARTILNRGGVDDACVARCCATLARSPDEADREIARHERAAIWLRGVESETRLLTAEEQAAVLSDDYWGWKDPAPPAAFDEIPDVCGAAVKIVAVVGGALIVAALVWWFATSAAAAVEWARGAVGPYGVKP